MPELTHLMVMTEESLTDVHFALLVTQQQGQQQKIEPALKIAPFALLDILEAQSRILAIPLVVVPFALLARTSLQQGLVLV